MLALRDLEVARVEEAVGGILEGPAERGTRRLEQRLPKRRDVALAAEGAGRRLGSHRRRIGRRSGENEPTQGTPPRVTCPEEPWKGWSGERRVWHRPALDRSKNGI